MKNGALAATAYHEAGHAVASLYLFRPIRKVTIIPDKKSGNAGACHNKGRRYLEGIDVQISGRKRDRMFDEIKIYFAGMKAQRRFNKRSVRNWQGSQDFKKRRGLGISPNDRCKGNGITFRVAAIRERVLGSIALGRYLRRCASTHRSKNPQR